MTLAQTMPAPTDTVPPGLNGGVRARAGNGVLSTAPGTARGQTRSRESSREQKKMGPETGQETKSYDGSRRSRKEIGLEAGLGTSTASAWLRQH